MPSILYKLAMSLKMTIPDEAEHETLLTDDEPIEIVFEDDHF